jgi:hypothetical protein
MAAVRSNAGRDAGYDGMLERQNSVSSYYYAPFEAISYAWQKGPTCRCVRPSASGLGVATSPMRPMVQGLAYPLVCVPGATRLTFMLCLRGLPRFGIQGCLCNCGRSNSGCMFNAHVAGW